MSELPAHTAFFGDGQKVFRLTPALAIELERLTGTPIMALSRRFYSGQCGFKDLTETLRLGLIGGGTSPEEAERLVSTYSAVMSVTALYNAALPVLDLLMLGRVSTDE